MRSNPAAAPNTSMPSLPARVDVEEPAVMSVISNSNNATNPLRVQYEAGRRAETNNSRPTTGNIRSGSYYWTVPEEI
jgi:hypothetical protein